MRAFRFLPALLLVMSGGVAADIAVYRDAANSYVGANIALISVEANTVDQTPGGFVFRLGGMVDKHWGAEVRLGRTFWHEVEYTPGGGSRQVDIDHVIGVYGTGRLPFNVPFIEVPLVDKLFVQAMAGVADVQLRSRTVSCTPDCTRTYRRNDATDLSWGVGMGMELALPKIELPVFNAPRRIGLSLEYMNYGGKYDVDFTGIEAGLMVFF
jgi:hypothetical protein